MRYTVVEKLQNFMAAEGWGGISGVGGGIGDSGIDMGKGWSEEAREELFRGLLGGREGGWGLAEGEGEGGDGGGDGEGEGEEEALMLFRN